MAVLNSLFVSNLLTIVSYVNDMLYFWCAMCYPCVVYVHRRGGQELFPSLAMFKVLSLESLFPLYCTVHSTGGVVLSLFPPCSAAQYRCAARPAALRPAAARAAVQGGAGSQ